ncbi:hypothetical protein A0H81_12989 [Grifola frondosa]|uniref:Concentrative nucleoside transporter C-terminal domain-containing protein n=1 Tax=Grifola frondosa TaxID=5627 RepID=A0A1C7LSC3_GRIFR|nr:hypothetical protein A0H81_12989 [Grifola frondosa]
MGVPRGEILRVAELLATKLVANEFVGYTDLQAIKASDNPLSRAHTRSPRRRAQRARTVPREDHRAHRCLRHDMRFHFHDAGRGYCRHACVTLDVKWVAYVWEGIGIITIRIPAHLQPRKQ